MAMDPQQKKQVITLVILLAVAGAAAGNLFLNKKKKDPADNAAAAQPGAQPAAQPTPAPDAGNPASPGATPTAAAPGQKASKDETFDFPEPPTTTEYIVKQGSPDPLSQFAADPTGGSGTGPDIQINAIRAFGGIYTVIFKGNNKRYSQGDAVTIKGKGYTIEKITSNEVTLVDANQTRFKVTRTGRPGR